MTTRSCVSPGKQFIFGIHKPGYVTKNLRTHNNIVSLGTTSSGSSISNNANFPETDVIVAKADWIFEVANPFSFKGSTFINKKWADTNALTPERIQLPPKPTLSFTDFLIHEQIAPALLKKLPPPLLLALATTSTDSADLIQLAEHSCTIKKDSDGIPKGLEYKVNTRGKTDAVIHNHALFEAVANNPDLPDSYKLIMVLRPGVQGKSEIVGEYKDEKETHVFEYLRSNSYIAEGHYAANMADDAIRYSISCLSEADMTGLRHLYYQRSFVRLASDLGIQTDASKNILSEKSIETLRQSIISKITKSTNLSNTATLWGWNFGFDYSPTGYRLHASHQQVHQQYAMLPETIEGFAGNMNTAVGEINSFACGDMVAEMMRLYNTEHNTSFFVDYLFCIRNNVRMDGKTDLEADLIVWEDEHVMLFVPKAQTSQWELQLIALTNTAGDIIGNILEADTASRMSLNRGIFFAQKALNGLGATMVTSIEYSKRMGRSGETGQHLLYSFQPRLPQSPGAFSETQLRYINGHYPEDFALVCRQQLQSLF